MESRGTLVIVIDFQQKKYEAKTLFIHCDNFSVLHIYVLGDRKHR